MNTVRIYLKLLFRITIIFLFSTGLLILLPSQGTGDVKNWTSILTKINTSHLKDLFPGCLAYDCGVFYPLTYPPGHFLFMILFALIFPIKLIGSFLTFKLGILLFYILSLGTLIVLNNKFVRQKQSEKLSAIHVILTFLTLPSLIINTQGLGYTDIFLFPALTLTILFLSRYQFFPTGFFFGVTLLIKWQPILILPLIVLYIWKTHLRRFKNLSHFALGLLIPPMSLLKLNQNIFQALFFSLFSGAGKDPILSSALNFQWIATFFYKLTFPKIFLPMQNGVLDYIDMKTMIVPPVVYLIPKVAFFCIAILILYKYLHFKIRPAQQFQHFLITAITLYVSYFMISSGVHENHLTFGVFLMLTLYILQPSKRNLFILFTIDIVNFLNMFVFYGLWEVELIPRVMWGLDITLVLAFISFILYLVCLNAFFSNRLFTDANDRGTKRQ